MPPILYRNIRNGEEVNITDKEYQSNIAQSSEFKQHFFSDFNNSVTLIKTEPLTNGTVLYTYRYNDIDKDICVLWGPLKNSGEEGKNNKRIQVLPSVPLKEETPYIAIGGYNTVDKVLYTAVFGVREFIRHAQNGSAYSSLWVDYSYVFDTYNKKVTNWMDGVGRKVVGCTADCIGQLHETIKNEILSLCNRGQTELLPNDENPDNDSVKFIDFSGEIGKYSEEMELPRNPLFRYAAIQRENFTCELCGTKHTFVDRDNNEYFEGHHLIMYNVTVQRRFKYCLDHPSNIICLCPTCHRKIHHSSKKDTSEMLVKLFTKHNDLQKSYEIKDLNDIIDDYLQHEE